MRRGSPISDLANALVHARIAGFNEVTEEVKNWRKSREAEKDVFETRIRRPREDEITLLAMFEQTWGSTALGFGGIGGAAITTATTTVLRFEEQVAVYFAGSFAYLVTRPNEQLAEDLRAFNMAEVSRARKYATRKDSRVIVSVELGETVRI